MPTLFAATDPLVVAFLACLAVLFFIPAYVAFRRGHRNATAILVLNVLLFLPAVVRVAASGPGVGSGLLANLVFLVVAVVWVIALVWSLLAHQGPPRYRPPPHTSAPVATAATRPFTCPHCASDVRVPYSLVGTVVVCPRCRGEFTAASS